MTINVAVNGFGRIGRLVTRLLCANRNIKIVAINDIVPADNLAYLFKYDTTHRRYKGDVYAEGETLVVDGQAILALAERDPTKLPWKELNVDFVIESTGFFTTPELAAKHLEAGAKRVIITAPAKGDVPTFVMGVNEKNYQPEKDSSLGRSR